MSKRYFLLITALIAASPSVSSAMDSGQYSILQESLFVFLSAICLLLAAAVFSVLKGGSLGVPWIFILAGFAVAGVGATIHLLETLEIVLHQYDLRLAMLLTRVGSVFLFTVGLFLYKKGLG
jgi:hypothetical protein